MIEIMPKSSEKEALRDKMLRQRATFYENQDLSSRDKLSEAIHQNLDKAIPWQGGMTIAGYWPINTECDLRPFLYSIHERNVCLALPIAASNDLVMRFYHWSPETHLRQDLFGVMVPDGTDPLEPDVFLVPLVAFDKNGHRLGYGRGYYDATLEHLRKQRSITAIGVAFDEQSVDNLPFDETDQPLDMIVTPTRVIPIK